MPNNNKQIQETKVKINIAQKIGLLVALFGGCFTALALLFIFFNTSSNFKPAEVPVTPTKIDIKYDRTVVASVLPSELGVDSIDEAKVESVVRSEAKYFASLQQYYNKIPVFGGRMIVYVNNGKTSFVKKTSHQNINIDTTTRLANKEAATAAKDSLKAIKAGYRERTINSAPDASLESFVYYDLTGQGAELNYSILIDEAIDDLISTEKLVIYSKYKKYSLAWQVQLPLIEIDGYPLQLTYFIDANSGQVIDVRNNILSQVWNVDGQVTGLEWEDPITDVNQQEMPFESNYVNLGTTQETTDTDGDYLFFGTSQTELSSLLEGPWAKVINIREAESNHTAIITEQATHNWNWDADDISYKDEESNAFYHVNRIHDYISDLGVTEMDFQMTTNVNYNNSCNAYYETEGPSLNFYKYGAGGYHICESTAVISDVIYHEYGHGIVHSLDPDLLFVGGYWDEPGNIHEALADYWACSVNNDPEMAEGFYTNKVTPLRYCNSDDTYPEDYSPEPHSGAQIISGILWDIRETMTSAILEPILIDALRLRPITFFEFAEALLVIDDTDADLSNGTPNITTICGAFSNHGIYAPSCAGYTSAPIASIINLEKNESVSGIVTVIGTVYPSQGSNLTSYTLSSDGMEVNTGSNPVFSGEIGTWDTRTLDDGLYTLTLTANDSSGQQSSVSVSLYVDNFNLNMLSGISDPPAVASKMLEADLNDTVYYKVAATYAGSAEGQCPQCSYRWFRNGAVVGAQSSPQYSTTLNGPYVAVRATVTSTFGGSDSIIVPAYTGNRQITTNPSYQEFPDISNNRIVYHDRRNTTLDEENLDIYLYDLNTNTESPVVTNNAGQWIPAIYGNTIVWEDYRINNDIEIYRREWPGSESRVTSNTAIQWNIAVAKDYIVWEDIRTGSQEIFYCNKNGSGCSASAPKVQVTNTPGRNALLPAVDGTRIVWMQRNYNNDLPWLNTYGIYTCDISLNGQAGGCLVGDQKLKVIEDTHYRGEPAVYGDTIVWMDTIDGNQQIYMCGFSLNGQKGGCLETDQKIRVSDTTSAKYYPEIWANYIIWLDFRDSNSSVYMHNLASGEEMPLIYSSSLKNNPDIGKEGAVWEIYSADYSNVDVYYQSLPLCGDADANGTVNISDATYLIGYVFGNNAVPYHGDVDANGKINISDVVYLIGYIFGADNPLCKPQEAYNPEAYENWTQDQVEAYLQEQQSQ
ncbi:hypothetical protein KKF61_04060 [Patescibacteria group bacterium]|nr:hypothetical protein [Patescibacteria group bacterium]MBU0963989.1 hypothetical protein [Patescibacteria group bacterium]